MKGRSSDLVCVFKGQAFEAEVVRARLEDSGIDAMIMNNTMSAIFSTYSAMAGSYCVMVNPGDEEKANVLISEKDQ
ncbi:MAG: DUF2007 domain-containing protein [Bacteroidaceae bacterium]|nr:DUF2007 domain-containing protein [Bacteroidaceae bacterium]